MIIRGSETVIIVRKNTTGDTDEYGIPVVTTENIVIKNCLIALSSSNEEEDENRNPEDIKLKIFLPKGTLILEEDTFIIRNTHFVKDGISFDWGINPFAGFSAGVELFVRKRNG
jgi:hypothetical protein